MVTDENGAVKSRQSFDPWGRKRNPQNWTYKSSPWPHLFDRGFTGHEHLDNFDLINMNGRMYDPWLGRFLSPDPFVQASSSSQNYNRYSYAFNNPLKYIDPSGYSYLQILQQNNHFKGGGFYYRGSHYSYNSEADAFLDANGNAANSGGYYYDWQTGEYKNGYGQNVPYFGVHNNYVVPNSVTSIDPKTIISI